MAATIGSLVRRVRGWAAAEGGDDRPLLDRFIAQRDEAAFDALVRRHGGLVFGLCRRLLPGVHDAEDAFQATFLVLAQKAGRIRRSEALAGWLHQVSYRIAVKLRTDQSRRLACQPAPRTSSADDPCAAALAGEVREALDEELQRLPTKLRVPVLLCYIEDLTVEQAAARLGWPLGTIKSRLARGRQQLRQALTRRGLGMPAALGAAAVAPEALVAASTRLGMLAILGGGIVSAPHVAQLAQHALATMTFAKTKAWVLVLVVAAVGVGAGLLPRLFATDSDDKARTEIAQVSAKPLAVDDAGDDTRAGFDRFGDPLPPGALMRLGTVRFRQGNNIEALSISPDDRLVVTCSQDDFNIVKLWDAVTGHEVRKLDVGDELVRATAFAPKEDLVAVGYKGSILLFQGSTGAKLRQLVGKQTVNGYMPTSGIEAIVFSPDGKLVAASYQTDAVRVWDVATGRALPQFQEHKSRGWRLAFSPDSKSLATGGYDYNENGYFVRLWDVQTGKELRQLHGHRHGIVALAFSPDGKHLATGAHYYDGVMRLWEVATGKLVHEFTGHDTEHGVRAVAFTPDGRTLISASEVIRFWDVATRKELRQAPQIARRMVLTSGGKTLIAADQGAIHRWDVATARPLDPYSGHDARLGMVVCSADGSWTATRDHEGGMRIWEARTGKERLRGHVGYRCNVSFSPDGKLFAAAGSDPNVKYEVKHAKSRAIMTGMKVRLWDTATWKEINTFKAHEQQIDYVGFLPDNKTMLTADAYSGIVRLWDGTTGKELRQFNAHKSEKAGLNRAWYSVALSPDGKRLAVGEQPARFTTGFAGDPVTLRIWDVATGKELYELEGHRNQIWGLAFSPDSQLLASSGGGLNDQISIWDLGTGGRVRHLPGEGHPLAWSADGTMLASASYRARLIQVWDVATGTERRRFEGHTQNIWGLAFSPDDAGLFSASADTTALYWGLTGMRRTMRFPHVKLTDAQRREHWRALGGDDARKSQEARWTLSADPDVVPFLEQHLSAVAKVDDGRIARLIAGLGDDDFDVRAAATRELQELDTVAETALRAALGPGTPLETKRRIERLLQRMERIETTGTLSRHLNAVRILGHNGGPEALGLLRHLAGGEPRARLTRAARATLSSQGR